MTYTEEEKGLVYKDEDILCFLKQKPSSPGHTLVVPKKHATIIEEIPDDVIGKLFMLSSQISALLFEVVGAQGTNILIQNGAAAGQRTAHAALEVIPRKEGDSLGLRWEGKKAEQEELDDTARIIQEALENPPEEVIKEGKEESLEEIKEHWAEKYMQRVP